MIFRRGKKNELANDKVPQQDAETDLSDVDGPDTSDPDTSDPDTSDPDTSDPDTPELDLEALDGQEWRAEGPFDIGEVDLDDEVDDDLPRIDLGAMVLAGYEGLELRLQMAEETKQIVSAMMINGDSALEVAAYAAPRSGGLWAELRDEMIEEATENGGSVAVVEGPFGVELRRLLPVSTPEGEQGYQPSRMWVVEGPRWLLRGIVYGQAALEDGVDPPVAEILDSFRKIIVRRGDEAMAPGDLLPLSLPHNVTAALPPNDSAALPPNDSAVDTPAD